MCGRFSFTAQPGTLRGQMGDGFDIPDSLAHSYNVAPTQSAYVWADEQLRRMAWGLVPHWAKDRSGAAKCINARMEGIESKPSFRQPIRQQRCVVPADSFYEWRVEGRRRIPYRILPADGSLLMMAGLWDTWAQADGGVWHTFAIVTVAANADMQTLHTRMPALLLGQDACRQWLSPLPLGEVLDLLRPAPVGTLTHYRVSDKVNGVQYDGPDLHEPVPEPPTLFS